MSIAEGEPYTRGIRTLWTNRILRAAAAGRNDDEVEITLYIVESSRWHIMAEQFSHFYTGMGGGESLHAR